jgi:hypothetical protein
MMASFLLVIKRSIANKSFTKEYYQTVIANWSLNGWLTDPEVVEALAYLDEIFPDPVPEVTE